MSTVERRVFWFMVGMLGTQFVLWVLRGAA